jgi:hypothetical protein
MQAQEHQLVAEMLHKKAANEILNIINRKNDWWRLDLYGLHAKEAIQVLHVACTSAAT